MDHEQLNPDNSSPAALELDQRLVRALEAAPEIRIPAGFAARVASQVAPRPMVSSTPTHYGDYAMILGILASLAALFGLYTRNQHTFDLVETLLLTQFIGLTVWLSLRRHSLR
ncbi:MAG: hypothetical protein WDN23_07275 [Edaphobacter sp.]